MTPLVVSSCLPDYMSRHRYIFCQPPNVLLDGAEVCDVSFTKRLRSLRSHSSAVPECNSRNVSRLCAWYPRGCTHTSSIAISAFPLRVLPLLSSTNKTSWSDELGRQNATFSSRFKGPRALVDQNAKSTHWKRNLYQCTYIYGYRHVPRSSTPRSAFTHMLLLEFLLLLHKFPDADRYVFVKLLVPKVLGDLARGLRLWRCSRIPVCL